jgi:hypothetical protein
MQTDEQLRLPARERAHRMCVPDLLKKCGSHVTVCLWPAQPSGTS